MNDPWYSTLLGSAHLRGWWLLLEFWNYTSLIYLSSQKKHLRDYLGFEWYLAFLYVLISRGYQIWINTNSPKTCLIRRFWTYGDRRRVLAQNSKKYLCTFQISLPYHGLVIQILIFINQIKTEKIPPRDLRFLSRFSHQRIAFIFRQRIIEVFFSCKHLVNAGSSWSESMCSAMDLLFLQSFSTLSAPYWRAAKMKTKKRD